MKKTSILRLSGVILASFLFLGCAETRPEMTYDMTGLTKNKQTPLDVGSGKKEVLKVLGEPDLMESHESGDEVWVYYKSSKMITTSTSESGIWMVSDESDETSVFGFNSKKMLSIVVAFDAEDNLLTLNYWLSFF